MVEIDEKVESVKTALDQINVEQAARDAGVSASTLRYDLEKLEQALPKVLADRKRGPKPKEKVADSTAKQADTEEPTVCPECGDKVTKNGTYIIQTASVQRLARRLQRFVKKHGHAINLASTFCGTGNADDDECAGKQEQHL